MSTTPPNTPPPIPPRRSLGPPPLPKSDPPSLSYFVPPPPVGWAVVGASSASEWHTARVILTKHDIIARMGNSVDETGHTIEMLVPASQEAYARSLLAGAIDSAAEVEQRTGGFPVVVANVSSADSAIPLANPVGPFPVGARPVRPRLSRRQVWTYNIILVWCVVALILILFLTAMAFFLPD